MPESRLARTREAYPIGSPEWLRAAADIIVQNVEEAKAREHLHDWGYDYIRNRRACACGASEDLYHP